MGGKAVHIIKKNEASKKLELDEKALKKLFQNERFQNCELAIISVAGPLRKGKSFLLSLFVRYLIKGSSEDWLNDLDAKCEGFEWKNGVHAHTTGILIWSDVFYYQKSDGKEVGIILMDTQGCFDTKTTMEDNVTIFALSTMLASVQIYNLMQLINETDLQNLQLFSQFGKSASKAPFQKLLFLVRDWSNKDEYDYGKEGGKRYLEEGVFITHKNKELEITRKCIKSCFHKLECFLLPHPGLEVSQQFNGDLNKLNVDFVEHIKKLVPIVLSKESINVKKINGHTIKGREFIDYITTYWGVFKNENGEMPEPKSVYIASAEAQSNSVCKTVQKNYTTKMDALVDKDTANKNELEFFHRLYIDEAKEEFINKTDFCHDLLKEPFLDELSKFFAKCFIAYVGIIESKNKSDAEKQVYLNEIQKLKDESQNTKLVSYLTLLSIFLKVGGACVTYFNPVVGTAAMLAGIQVEKIVINNNKICKNEELTDTNLGVASTGITIFSAFTKILSFFADSKNESISDDTNDAGSQSKPHKKGN